MLTRLPILKPRLIKAILKDFVLGSTAAATARRHCVSRHTINQWFNHWREAIFEHCRLAPRFSGEVEVDQTQLTGRGSKKSKLYKKQFDSSYGLPYDDPGLKKIQEKMRKLRELERIRLGKKLWKPVKALGIWSQTGQVYTQIIPDEKRDTLMPIIYMVVEEGSTIYTDSWRSYGKLKEDIYKHKVVDHSKAFTNTKGDHINHIESFWSFAKRRLTSYNGLNKRRAVLMLKECEFFWNNGGIENWKRAIKKIEGFCPIPKKSQKRPKFFKPPINPNPKRG